MLIQILCLLSSANTTDCFVSLQISAIEIGMVNIMSQLTMDLLRPTIQETKKALKDQIIFGYINLHSEHNTNTHSVLQEKLDELYRKIEPKTIIGLSIEIFLIFTAIDTLKKNFIHMEVVSSHIIEVERLEEQLMQVITIFPFILAFFPKINNNDIYLRTVSYITATPNYISWKKRNNVDIDFFNYKSNWHLDSDSTVSSESYIIRHTHERFMLWAEREHSTMRNDITVSLYEPRYIDKFLFERRNDTNNRYGIGKQKSCFFLHLLDFLTAQRVIFLRNIAYKQNTELLSIKSSIQLEEKSTVSTEPTPGQLEKKLVAITKMQQPCLKKKRIINTKTVSNR
ncbi:hypothetical protein CDIK_0622 [Cucumispora dikerogammari]|nr:hypothetical protein CDIK_0622 [Cucumispora dikerogammari]